jgi:hypothetical protein
MKLIDLIKKALKDKGISEKHAERVQKAFKIEKEEDIDASVIIFKDTILPAITEAETLGKTAGKTEAETASIAEYEKKHGLKDGKPIVDPKKEHEKTDDVPAGIKALLDAQAKQIETLTGLVTKSVNSVASAEKTATAKRLISDAKLPENWAGRVNVESEISIEDQVNTLKEEYTSIQQGIINEAVASGQYAPGSVQLKERSEEEWTKLMNEESKTGNQGVVDLGIK